jgi:ubiquinone/menaquinone biosynthesis C-methylase UbiE
LNRHRLLRQTATLLILLAACVSSCTSEPKLYGSQPLSEAQPLSGAQPPPEGLPDGINDQFLSTDLDVEKFVDRFEGESREVYAGRHAIVSALGLSKGDRVADIGAGTGFFSVLFAEQVGDQGGVYAVEISPNFLEHLRNLATGEDQASLQVVEGTMTSVELAPASVDLAFLCDVYHHFESPPDTLSSLHDAIRPGGSLVLIDFERIPGESPKSLLDHVRAGQEVFRREIEQAGFVLEQEIQLDELTDNYVLRFRRPEAKR